MLNIISIPTHAPLIAVEDGRVDQVRVLGPVPIGCVALIGTLAAKGSLVCPDIVAVPVHEVRSAVDRGRHVHVDDSEVIVAGLGTRILSCREF